MGDVQRRLSVKRSSAAALMQFQGISLSDLDRGELDPCRKIGILVVFHFSLLQQALSFSDHASSWLTIDAESYVCWL